MLNNPTINSQNLRPFKYFCMTIGAIPSSYMEAMSYQELLMWFCDYLKNTVIPTVNNNANAVTELQNLYVELKNYVDNYFINLDVQEEINNKLDEMAENGTLENLLTNYTKLIKVYNTTQEMINDKNNLQNNQKIQTLGYNNINDSGGALFYITNQKINDYYQINLENGLYATIFDEITPENTNQTLDSFINNYNYINKINFNKSEYNIVNPIIIDKSIFIDFKNININYIGENVIDDLIKFGFLTTENFENYSGIVNLKINGNTKVKNVLHVVGGKSINLSNISINKPLQYGLLIDETLNQTWELNAKNITVNGSNDISQCLSAIKLQDLTDCIFENIYPINGSESWLDSNVNGCIFNNIHGYSYPETLNTKTGLNISGNNNKFNNIIVDTPTNIGITVNNNYNSFNNISLNNFTNLENAIAIIDSDFNSYNGITLFQNIDTIIKSNATNLLNISNIKNTMACNKDIALSNNKLPYKFIYDNSGNATNLLIQNFYFLNQAVYVETPNLTLNLPIAFQNTNYKVDIIINRTQPAPYNIVKNKNTVEIKFNPDNIGDGLVFDVYLSLPKL